MNKKYIWIVMIVILIVSMSFLFFIGIFSLNGLCGIKSGHLGNEEMKSWDCKCIGIITERTSTSYDERLYCTGLNLSSPRQTELFNPNMQRPIEVE